jgi:HAMP domain-containing protein/signal transduction histidine kinase/CheY-like chemotaxis protein
MKCVRASCIREFIERTLEHAMKSVSPPVSNGEFDPAVLLTVLTAIKKGDFSVRMPLDWTGVGGKIADTVNDIVETNDRVSRELDRVSTEVGRNGQLAERASFGRVGGTWSVQEKAVNALITDLVRPTVEIARVIGAVARGDLTQTMLLEVDGKPIQGEFMRTGVIVNTMVEQLSSFASEVTRVAREVGTEGKLGGQADVKGVAGTWKDLTDNVNSMAGNLTGQVRNIAEVTTAVANGDLSKKITVDAKGEIQELKGTINTMVDQLSSFASEVTRVAREVGTEGKLGGQADVKGVAGTWKDLTDNVNSMAGNLTGQVRNIAEVTTAVANGDLSKKITVDAKGEIQKLKGTINTMVDQLSSFASEVTRVAREVGTEGKLGGQADVKGVAGTWRDLTESVNGMASNLTTQMRNIADVTTAVANGDLTKKIAAEAKGEIAELKSTINTMVDQLSSFASEVTRVAREVGTEGKLGGQAQVKGVGGTWKDLTENVNAMAGNLTAQVRNIAQVTTAVANGDLSKKITVDVKGEILELKNTVNVMVDQLNSFASEVTRVAREVGTDGKLGGQAEVIGVGGTWKDLTDSVNGMASNLTQQVRNIADVTTAVAKGDLARKITVEAKGEILELKNTINTMVDQLSTFADEVTRVAREVGTEGMLGGQAEVIGVGGTWKDLTDSVNGMASNLTQQVRNIADVTTAVAKGDLARKITVEAKGEILELKNTINTMVDQLSTFADEVTRVAREVGSEGKLGGQGQVPGVAGTWKDLTDSVNGMASNLTSQVRNIAQVTTAVANGDLTKKITVDAKGEIQELKNTINIMVDQLQTFGAEVTRVAREVGTEGKLGGQATVAGVSGTWKDLTDSVNGMASNLTGQVRNIAEVTIAVANGDLSRKITVDVRGEFLQLKETINSMVDQLRSFAAEVTRVAREVGSDGRLGGQANVPGAAGTWKDLTDNVNGMASNLTAQVRNIAQVTTAVANGDLSKKITVDVKGEILDLKNTVNTMVDQLNSFAAEVTRVAREVGTEGKLGGQALVGGVAGIWKDLTDNVNLMASNLTNQVRGIAEVVTAVAMGDLNKKLTVEARGEIAELADTINNMTNTLALFAEQVTGVAREVGVEGKLGGQANVPGAAGTWKYLTENVNGLAANLTNQVRAIADVATAVTKGDLTRNVEVEAKGEVAELKDNVNEMIRNLKETTEKNTEQDWLKTNLARFTRMLQGQREMFTVCQLILSELAPLVKAQHGVFYIKEDRGTEPVLSMKAGYAYQERKGLAKQFRLGEGLVGQCALEKKRILLQKVPGSYVKINSGLGQSAPLNIVVLPVMFETATRAVIELASFEHFSPTHLAFLEQLTESIGIVLNTIEANSRTEVLLQQSQKMAQELQSQQEELQQTNQELEEKASLLAAQNAEVERKNIEVEIARKSLEEKAAQLSLTSKYKSEFLANMSHELRTPLNSLLLLSQQLRDNPDKNLSNKQVDYARTIHASGDDLLHLINDILDLSKIESGTVTADIAEVPFLELRDFVEQTFRHVADNKKLGFAVELEPGLPPSLFTDERRLKQIAKNLLSNAFKFTAQGNVVLKMAPAAHGWSPDHPTLSQAATVIEFSVSDTGIGISPDKQQVIFEAFQQADGTTSRKYGGTGLGLAISRELARFLGGEIRLESEPKLGSTFTLYLPLHFATQSRIETLAHAADLDLARRKQDVRPLPLVNQAGRQNLVPALAQRDEVPFRSSEMTEEFAPVPLMSEKIDDDRANIQAQDRVILIVEDDPRFANILVDFAHERGFKALVAMQGLAALPLVRQYQPDAITLDIELPDTIGWAVLDQLKHDPATRHIPVHIITIEKEMERGRKLGALSYLTKPADEQQLKQTFARMEDFIERKVKKLLLVEGDPLERDRLLELIDCGDAMSITVVASASEALDALEYGTFDCMVLDLQLPDRSSGIELIEKIKTVPALSTLPIIVSTRQPLRAEEEERFKAASKSVVVKNAWSEERLLDDVTLFLHRVEADLPESKRLILEHARKNDPVLANKKVLVVDDDVRNIFSLTAVLERQQMQVLSAENGKDAIAMLQKLPDIDIVLMDVMMPEMDGYQTMRAIRKQTRFKTLPIISLTAKAMKGDREKCLEAGASDYITKPVDTEQLFSLLRVWLYR